MKTAIVGINWGDEGKGRMVDMMSENYDIVVRYQGGNNAGHTVVNPLGKFILNLLPSGILRSNVINVMGNGMVIDLKHLCQEITRLRAQGISITPDNLKISDRATICMPYHIQQDCLEEDRLKDKKFGSTRRGIAPVYADKYLKKTLRMGDLIYKNNLSEKVQELCEWKSLMFRGYNETVNAMEIENWLSTYGEFVKPFICDTG
jgi:Adenylosuccinate synthase